MKGRRRLCIKESTREMTEKEKVNAAEAEGLAGFFCNSIN